MRNVRADPATSPRGTSFGLEMRAVERPTMDVARFVDGGRMDHHGIAEASHLDLDRGRGPSAGLSQPLRFPRTVVPARQPPVSAVTERVGIEQITAVFNTAPIGVVGALTASIIVAAILSATGNAPPLRSFGWAGVLAVPAVGHLVLCSRFRRSRSRARNWRRWGLSLSAFYLAEGLVWGWAGLWLVTPGNTYGEYLVLIVTGSVAAGSVTAIASYLPAFCAFFIATLSPLVIQGAFVTDNFRQSAAILALLLMATMLFLARRANRTFVAGLHQRFKAEDLAEDLRVQRNVAELASLSKSRFLAAASHDLRQPVHALGMFVGALKARSMDDEARRLVDHIEGSVAAMDDLFGALLDISRLDAGIVEVEPKSFPIQRLLERICRELEAEAVLKGVRVVLRPCSATVMSDPILLERVLRNIVANAVRYTDRGRVLVGCRRRERLVVQVWDTGRGIPADRQGAVFDEFFQLGNPERDRTKGLGLGLGIVKRLTALLDHDLTLCSQLARGSVFSVAMPYSDGVAPAPTSVELAFTRVHRAALILVVDDEALVLEGMRSLLSSWGHTVIAARSGAEMLERLAGCPNRPDLLICDYRLRDEETGVAVIERLQSEYNDDDIPALLITGDTAPDRLAEARASGFLLLHKPVPDAKLRAAIVNLLHAVETRRG